MAERIRRQPQQEGITLSGIQALKDAADKSLALYLRRESVGSELMGRYYQHGQRAKEEAGLKRGLTVLDGIIRAGIVLQDKIGGEIILPEPSKAVLAAPDTLRVVPIPSSRLEKKFLYKDHLAQIETENAEPPETEGYYLGVIKMDGKTKQAAEFWSSTLEDASRARSWSPVMFDVDYSNGAHLRAATLDEVYLLKQLGMVGDINIGTATKETNTDKHFAVTKENELVEIDPTDANFPPVLVIDFRPRK